MSVKTTVISGAFNAQSLTIGGQGSQGGPLGNAQTAFNSLPGLADAVNINTTGSREAINFIDDIVKPKKAAFEKLKDSSKSYQFASSLNEKASELVETALTLANSIDALEGNPSDPDAIAAVLGETEATRGKGIEDIKKQVAELREEYEKGEVEDPALESTLEGLESFVDELALNVSSDGVSQKNLYADVSNSSGYVGAGEAYEAASLASAFQTRANYYQNTIENTLKAQSDNDNLDFAVEGAKGAKLSQFDTANNLVEQVAQQVAKDGVNGIKRDYGDGSKILQASLNLLNNYGIDIQNPNIGLGGGRGIG